MTSNYLPLYKSAAKLLLGYELFTLVLCWMSLRAPRLDPGDGSAPATNGSIILSTHLYAYAFLIVFFAFAVVFVRLWKGSSRRRR